MPRLFEDEVCPDLDKYEKLLHPNQQNRRKLMTYLKGNPIYAPMKVSEFREIYF